uniref:CUB_2 domain-containing protein n=1 Tax=Caenorhabditis tropicalis TaxID=1561998 RepID=A0A1I7U1I2_9PELO
MSSVHWILAFALLVGISSALECVQIPDSEVIPGHFSTIPAGANATVQIPPNYSCTYNIKVPPMVYAHVRLENGLKGNNDLITVTDDQFTRTLVSSRSATVLNFYVFPNTTTTFKVVTKSVDMRSSFRLLVFYQKIGNSSLTHLGNSDFKYFYLNDLQVNSYKNPQTVQGTEQIVMSLAVSGWDADLFDNYFVIDGTFENPKNVYRMNRFVHQNLISTGNTLTVVGLDNRVSKSSVVFTPLSQALQFDFLSGIGEYFQANQLDIDSTSGNKKLKAVNVISSIDYVMFLSVQVNNGPSCSLKAVEAPPSPSSPVILDFSTVTQYPMNITHQSFSIIAENCVATLRMVAPS